MAETRKRDTDLGGTVRRQQSGAASVGHDGEPIAARETSQGEDARRAEKLRVGRHAHRSGALERRVEYPVGRRRSRRGSGAVATRFENDDRLSARRGAERGHETARIGYGLDIEHDAFGFDIGERKLEELANVDVAARAQRGDRREADARGAREVE